MLVFLSTILAGVIALILFGVVITFVFLLDAVLDNVE